MQKFVTAIIHQSGRLGTSPARHPREDDWAASRRYPIFAVADGVTLEPGPDGRYPRPSGAAAVARIFCRTVVREAETRYPRCSLPMLRTIFTAANRAVGAYNRSSGRTTATSNFWDFDLFATTGAFAVVTGSRFWWATIGDAFVAIINRHGRLTFCSPELWPKRNQHLPANWKNLAERPRRILIRKIFRNGVAKSGALIGYGVATGEPAATRYLNIGIRRLQPSDRLLLLTDGFAPHLDQQAFLRIFSGWPKDLPQKIKILSQKLAIQNPSRYGAERTIIAIKNEST